MTFERFTERARQVTVLAAAQARAWQHNYVGTEHLLAGLAAETEGLAACVLEAADVTPARIEAQVLRIIPPGESIVVGQIPWTPRAKRVCELALREALSLGHNYIGTEHILLALIREGEGVGPRVLEDCGAGLSSLRNAVIEMLVGVRRRGTLAQWSTLDLLAELGRRCGSEATA